MAFTCACRVVRDHDVMASIEAGARTVDQVSMACGAGIDCGSCLPTIEALLDTVDDSTAEVAGSA
jgi:bacterioferritin-associated ferredoxin